MHAESQIGAETRHVLVDFGYTPEVLLNNMGTEWLLAKGYTAWRYRGMRQ